VRYAVRAVFGRACGQCKDEKESFHPPSMVCLKELSSGFDDY
jgi:hypothetical protein